ncbi:MAG: hypothetical protein P9M07_07050 [Candidatus Aceula meridiana]|nr:hypothetical protein [Candidatus Aceula meridiana]
MIDLKKLNEIDIKTLFKPDTFQGALNFEQLQNNLFKRKDILINIVLVLATLFGINAVIKNKNAESTLLKTEIEELEKKTDAIAEYEKQEKVKNNFMASVPKGFSGFTDVIDKVSVLADEAGVKIRSFDPAESQESDFFVTEKVGFLVSADNYNDMLSFVNKIETSEEGLRIDSWSNNEKRRVRQKINEIKKEEASEDYILRLSSIRLKNAK